MFQFTMREALLFTILVATAVAWWLDHRRLQAMHRDEVTRLHEEFAHHEASVRAFVIKHQFGQRANWDLLWRDTYKGKDVS